MPIDRSLLRPSLSIHEREGYYAEFHPDGTLSVFGYFENGQPRGWLLVVDEDGTEAMMQRVDRRTYSGKCEGSAVSLEDWVKEAIAEIYRTTEDEERCGFCKKDPYEVGQLFPGPTVAICDECVTQFAGAIAR